MPRKNKQSNKPEQKGVQQQRNVPKQYDDEGIKVLALLNIRSKLPKEAAQRIQEALEGLHDTKRNISQLSGLTLDAPPPPPPPPPPQDAIGSIIGATRQKKEKELAVAEKVVGILNKEWHAGAINITKELFESEIGKLEDRITALIGDIIVIRSSRYELGGRLLDDMIWRQDHGRINNGWPNTDSLIARYKTPEGTKLPLFTPKDAHAQWRFCKRVFKAYGAEEGHRNGAWCVISGQWHSVQYFRGVQIVRCNVGEQCAQYLFGPLDGKNGHLMGAKNGIPMHIYYAEALDEGRLVIIPDGDQEKGQASIDRWKVYWLYEADAIEKTPVLPPSGSALHGRSLEFLNDFRPDARYLYFAFCMSILRRQRHDVAGWWRDYLAAGSGNVWAAPGNYLRLPTLRKLAQRAGRLTAEEAALFAIEAGSGGITEHADEDQENKEMDNLCSDVCHVAAMQPSPNLHTWRTKLGKYNQSYEETYDDYRYERRDRFVEYDDSDDEDDEDDDDDEEEDEDGEDDEDDDEDDEDDEDEDEDEDEDGDEYKSGGEEE